MIPTMEKPLADQDALLAVSWIAMLTQQPNWIITYLQSHRSRVDNKTAAILIAALSANTLSDDQRSQVKDLIG